MAMYFFYAHWYLSVKIMSATTFIK